MVLAFAGDSTMTSDFAISDGNAMLKVIKYEVISRDLFHQSLEFQVQQDRQDILTPEFGALDDRLDRDGTVFNAAQYRPFRLGEAIDEGRPLPVVRPPGRNAFQCKPSSSTISSALSTSFAPSLIRLWVPLERIEVILPGRPKTSRFCSSAELAVISAPLLGRRLHDHHTQ